MPDAISGGIGGTVGSAWDSICRSFAQACTSTLQAFAGMFRAFPDTDVASVRNVYAISLTIGMTVALVLLLLQAGAVVWSRSGAALANAILGVAKAALASILTLEVASQLLAASDELTSWITSASGHSITDFAHRIATLFRWSGVAGTLLLILGLLGTLLTLVLWLELLLRNAAIAILVATAPIAAAGQLSGSTQEWWRKLVRTVLQLIMLKPVIALVFAVGFSMAGSATGIAGVLDGMAVLFLAVFAWPALARFFTFTSVAMGGGMGVGALVGAAANRGAGGPGIDPAAFGRASEAHAMSAAASGGSGPATGAAGTPAAGRAAGAMAAAGVAMQALQKTINALASRMEQTAGHGGIEGANPTAYPAGFPIAAGGYRRGTGGAPPAGAPAAESPSPTPPLADGQAPSGFDTRR